MAWSGSVRFGMGWSLCLLLLAHAASERFAHAAPPNDDFADRTLLSGTTNFIIASNVGGTLEPAESEHAGSEGGGSVWWTWTAPYSGSFIVSTEGSSFDT